MAGLKDWFPWASFGRGRTGTCSSITDTSGGDKHSLWNEAPLSELASHRSHMNPLETCNRNRDYQGTVPRDYDLGGKKEKEAQYKRQAPLLFHHQPERLAITAGAA